MCYDLIVVGGGLSGVCSAIASAREGLKTLLIEKYNCLGGTGTAGLVIPFMSYHTTINDKKVPLCGEIFAEIVSELEKMGATCNGWRESFNEEYLKLILNRLAINSGVELLFNTTLCGANVSDGKIDNITVTNVGGTYDLYARCYIDATGDGNLAFMSGFPFNMGRESDGLCQPMTLSFRVGNVNTALFDKEHKKIQADFKEKQTQGAISVPRESLLIFKTPTKGVLHFNCTRVCGLNPCDPQDQTKAEIIAREQVFELFQFLKNYESFKEGSLISTSIQIGIRESRRIVGNYTLTVDEIKECKKFDDSVARCNYDIDEHSPDGVGTSHYYFKDGEYYEIPFGCCVPKGSKNLFVVGRCISVDHYVQASMRTMPTVATIGESVGKRIKKLLV